MIPSTPTIHVLKLAAIAGALLLVATASCGRGQPDTLARVRRGVMRVGVAEHRPWTTVPSGGGGGGIEGALVAEVAKDLAARIEWVRSPESRLLHALELGELDVVIAGLTDDSPWKDRVAFTKPMYTDTIVVAGPERAPPLRDIRNKTVFVLPGDPAGAYVRRRGGVPRPIPNLGMTIGLVAAPTWQLPSLALTPTGITLYEADHVMAVSPGDDAWLEAVDASLAKRVRMMPEVLRMPRP